MKTTSAVPAALISLLAVAVPPRVIHAAAQAPPQFEVASVKPNASGDAKVQMQTPPGGRFIATNVTMRQLILYAYRLQESQLTGGPAWIDRDRFDILAKGDGADPSQLPLMVRALLAERFSLAAHTESKELPIYALVPAKTDRSLGPQLKRAAEDCAVSTPANRESCGMRIFPGNVTAGGATLAELAGALTPLVDRIVQDRSGLSGSFAFTLRWTPEQISPGLEAKARAMGLPPIDKDGPAIFTAVREQLGLKLDAMKGQVDVLVVDRAERPKAD